MIFNTLKDDFQDRESRSDYIVIKVIVPRETLEKAIQDAIQAS